MLTNKDIERIGEIMSLRLNEALKDVNEAIREHTQTLYGVDKKNGLAADVKELKTEVGKMKFWVAGVAGGISALVALGKQIIFGK
jgi:hypothetical protein